MVEWLAFRILEAPGSNFGPETAFQAFGGFVQFLQSHGGRCHLRFETFISFHILPNSLVTSHSVI